MWGGGGGKICKDHSKSKCPLDFFALPTMKGVNFAVIEMIELVISNSETTRINSFTETVYLIQLYFRFFFRNKKSQRFSKAHGILSFNGGGGGLPYGETGRVEWVPACFQTHIVVRQVFSK